MPSLKDFPLKEWMWPIVLTLGLVALACSVIAGTNSPPVLALAWTSVLFFWFIHCFTGDAYAKRTMGIIFSFFFMLLAFGVVSVMIMSVNSAKKFGVVEGCVESFDPNAHNPIQCDYPSDSVGVSATSLLKKLSAQEEAPDSGTDVGIVKAKTADAVALLKAQVNAKGDKPPKKVRVEVPQVVASAEASGHVVSAAASQTAKPPILAASRETAAESPSSATSSSSGIAADSQKFEDELLTLYEQDANYHYLINIGGHLTPYGKLPELSAYDGAAVKAFAIRGGLPVPLYFVLFALMGGAISLAKNIPGIQKRSDDSWVGTVQEPKLLPGATRELLLFQVLQFASAPILAIVAYHTIKPESMATSVVLAFSAGFASDVILDQIRKLSNGAQKGGPDPASPVSTTSISGVVTRARVAESGATVTLVGLSIHAVTNAKGEYTLMAVPTSPLPVNLEAHTGSGAPLTVTVTISVTTAAAVKKDIELQPGN